MSGAVNTRTRVVTMVKPVAMVTRKTLSLGRVAIVIDVGLVSSYRVGSLTVVRAITYKISSNYCKYS